MDRFVARMNLEHFQRMLAAETDPARRASLQRLIDEETARLEAAVQRAAQNLPPAPSSPDDDADSAA
jgi:hypothetical protein